MVSSELETINEIKVTPDIFSYFLVAEEDICNENLSSTCSEKHLRIKIENKLTFEEPVERL